MELDTGASCSLVSGATFEELKKRGAMLAPSTAKLCTYMGEAIRVVGSTNVQVSYEDQDVTLPLVVTEGNGPSLIGRNWLSSLRLNWKSIFTVRAQKTLDEILSNYDEVFHDDLGTLEGVTAKLHVFRYNRLPFGVSSAPSIFQRLMENLLQGIPGITVYVDDISVTGRTDEEHLQHLEETLKRLKTAGMRLKRAKCEFLLSSVEYLGHVISAEGLRTSDSKVKAILKAPAPQNVADLRSFLGLVNYYAKFLPDLATVLAPLYQLLQKT